jgi:hypothetical protein
VAGSDAICNLNNAVIGLQQSRAENHARFAVSLARHVSVRHFQICLENMLETVFAVLPARHVEVRHFYACSVRFVLENVLMRAPNLWTASRTENRPAPPAYHV